MPKIFISYRRVDSQAMAKLIQLSLAKRFGKKNVFLDTSTLTVGLWWQQIQKALHQADIVVVVIGPKWESEIQRRLNHPDDYVREEVKIAIRENKTIVLAFVDGVKGVDKTILPNGIQSLPDYEGFEILQGKLYDASVNELIKHLPKKRPLPFPLIPIILILLIAGGLLLTWLGNQPDAIETPIPSIPVNETEEILEADTVTPTVALTSDNTPIEPTVRPSATVTVTAEIRESSSPMVTPDGSDEQVIGQARSIGAFIRTQPDDTADEVSKLEPNEQVVIQAYVTTPDEEYKNWVKIDRGYVWIGGIASASQDSISEARNSGRIPTYQWITSNFDWQPREQTFDEIPMILVPIGCFMMGSTTGDSDESPISQQCIKKPFWIDKYEVSQADYARYTGTTFFTDDNLPVAHVTWREAKELCQLRGMRLPTEREWEYSARGPNGFKYPWGNNWNDAYAIFDDTLAGPAHIGDRPSESSSWVGAFDMIGNVWEWTSSPYVDYPYFESNENRTDTDYRVIRGGAWDSYLFNMTATFRGENQLNERFFDLGFRCARDYTA